MQSIVKLLPVDATLPPQLEPWVTCQSSLTARLQSSAGETHLEVLRQSLEAPSWWDKHALPFKSDLVIHREVLMWAKGVPCWYARTIIPVLTYQANTAFFDKLQTVSLGELIFNDDRIQRVQLTYDAISPQSTEYHWLTEAMHQSAEVLWVRRSLFHINTHPFYLLETLLPGLLEI